MKASCASDKSDEQPPTDNTNINARKAINFQVNSGMFPPTINLYAITADTKAITLSNRVAISECCLMSLDAHKFVIKNLYSAATGSEA